MSPEAPAGTAPPDLASKAARAALSAAIAAAAADVGLAAADVRVVGAERAATEEPPPPPPELATRDDDRRRRRASRRLMEGGGGAPAPAAAPAPGAAAPADAPGAAAPKPGPSPSPPTRPGTVDATVDLAVTQLSRTRAGSPGGGGDATRLGAAGKDGSSSPADPTAAADAAALLWSPAFVAGVKRAMSAAGFPVDVTLVRGVTGDAAVAAAAAGAGGPGGMPSPFVKPLGAGTVRGPSSASGRLSPAAKAATAGVLGSVAGLVVLAAAGFAVLRRLRSARALASADRLASGDGGGEGTGEVDRASSVKWRADLEAAAVSPVGPSVATTLGEVVGDGAGAGAAARASSPSSSSLPPAWASDLAVTAVLGGVGGGGSGADGAPAPPAPRRARDAVADGAVAVGAAIAGRYVVLQRLGRRTYAARGLGVDGTGGPAGASAAVVLKLFTPASAAAADREAGLLGALASSSAGAAAGSVAPLVADLPAAPPATPARCLVIARGAFTLEDWLAARKGGAGGHVGGVATLGGHPPTPTPTPTLFTAAALLAAVARLHARGVVHRLLAPRRVSWFEGGGGEGGAGGGRAVGARGTASPAPPCAGGQWRLTGASAAVREGEAARPVLALRYAAPEVVAAVAQNGYGTPMPASPSSDAWAVGALLFELWTGRALWGAGVADGAVVAGLLAEADPPGFKEGLAAIGDARARTVIQGLLVRDPAGRLSVAAALAAPLFGGVVV